jgi:hypothetical protein
MFHSFNSMVCYDTDLGLSFPTARSQPQCHLGVNLMKSRLPLKELEAAHMTGASQCGVFAWEVLP